MLPVLACSNRIKIEDRETKSINSQTPVCPVIESIKWHAWLDHSKQKNNSYHLNVSGELLLPNPAYNFTWSIVPTDNLPPHRLALSLKPILQAEMIIQVFTIKSVKYTLETSINNYQSISVYCEGKLSTQIENVMLIQ